MRFKRLNLFEFPSLQIIMVVITTTSWIYGSIGHKCPGLIADSRTSTNGNFSSPAWPAPYPPDAVCHYRLQGVPWEGIKINFHHFDLEPPYMAGCLSDYLELATVDVEGIRTFRGRYCGNTVPPPILLLHPTVELVFRSNHGVHHEGFFASYEFVDEAYVTPPRLNGTSPCGGVVTGIGGIITSPGYPIGYSAGLDCLWLIRVPYFHAIYVRIQQLEFQGSIANCEKAELGIYDGYEQSLESGEALKRYCGDLRYYKGEEERVLLSSRNRLLIRFQTRDPSKPVPSSISSADIGVGFRLIWSDVEFNTPENCSRQSRFACTEARFCFTKNHMGGASNCPDLRHYCISNDLVCDNVAHCAEEDPSDEQNCYRESLIIFVIGIPLGLLLLILFLCFLYYKRTRRSRTPQKNGQESFKSNQSEAQTCWNSKSTSSGGVASSSGKIGAAFPSALDLAPLARHPISLHNNLESPSASDIMSPASGFSDSESDPGTGAYLNQSTLFCPAHGPIIGGPLRHLPLPYPLLPVLQERNAYGSETFEEAGSTISSQNSEDFLNLSIVYEKTGSGNDERSKTRAIQSWRMGHPHQLQRCDTVDLSDDAKSSAQSSPSRICPRCLEKEGAEGDGLLRMINKQNSISSSVVGGVQFDSGIDSMETIMKNVSFDTTSSDVSIPTGTTAVTRWSGGHKRPPLLNVNNASIQTDLSGNGDSSNTSQDNSFCTTVTTFGVKEQQHRHPSKATDV